MRWSWHRFLECPEGVPAAAAMLDPPTGGWVHVPPARLVRVPAATEALVRLSAFVGLREITGEKLEEWRYRLDVLADLEITCRYAQTPEGPVPIRTTWEELQDHVGLRTTAREMTPQQFDRFARRLREGRLEERIFG
jgi:hypothetical protein